MLVSLSSVVAAVVVSSSLVGAGLLGRLPMPVLVGLAGCLVMPAATCLAWQFERRHRRRTAPPAINATFDFPTNKAA